MAVIDLHLKAGSKRSYSQPGERGYSYVLSAKTDAMQDAGKTLLLASGVPRIGHPYQLGREADGEAACNSVIPRQLNDSNTQWEIDCSFSTKPFRVATRQPIDNPLLRPPQRSWDGVLFETYPEKDIDGKAFRNTAQQILEPRPAVQKAYNVLVIQRNEAYFDFRTAVYFQNSTNASTWMGWQPGTVKLLPPRATEQVENGIFYAAVSYELHINTDGWDLELLNQGRLYRQRDDNGEWQVYHWADADGYRSTMLRPLDEDGNLLNEERVWIGDFVYLTFKGYKRRDYRRLRLEW